MEDTEFYGKNIDGKNFKKMLKFYFIPQKKNSQGLPRYSQKLTFEWFDFYRKIFNRNCIDGGYGILW